MSKVQFILLVSIVGFYALLLACLLLRVCAASYLRLQARLAPVFKRVCGELSARRRRAWESAPMHQAVVLDLQRITRHAMRPQSIQRKALC
ncbi:MAG TPA: hypothetical protein VGB17_12695 [Pyrinomonadaceae bacterium]|jgi:hypothetical protein